jgi:hypothetical protein
VFVVDTDYDKKSETLSKYVLKICERFKSLGIKSVLFTIYDLNESGVFIHEGVTHQPGDILLFPANSKSKIFFREKLTVLSFIKYVVIETYEMD